MHKYGVFINTTNAKDYANVVRVVQLFRIAIVTSILDAIFLV